MNLKKITNLNDIEKSEQYKIRKKEYNRQSYLKRKQNKENNNDIAIVQLNENMENKDEIAIVQLNKNIENTDEIAIMQLYENDIDQSNAPTVLASISNKEQKMENKIYNNVDTNNKLSNYTSDISRNNVEGCDQELNFKIVGQELN